MKITFEIELPDNLLVTSEAHAWYTNGGKDEDRFTPYQKTARMVADLEREAKFHAEQYLRNILTIHQTRPR